MKWARLDLIFYMFGWIICLYGCGSKPNQELIVETHENGNPKVVQVLDASGRILQVKTFHFNTYRESLVDYKDGKANGLLQRWGSTGELEETSQMKQGVREGESQTWYRKGQIMSSAEYQKGLLNGELKRYHPNGDLQAQEYYQKGTPIGEWKSWFANGKLESQNSCHANVEKGIKDQYQNDGVLLSHLECKAGVPNGDALENYASGKTKVHGQYLQGLQNGRWVWWRADGSLWMVNEYAQGIRHGMHIRLSDHGDTLERFTFHEGSGTVLIPCVPAIRNIFCVESTWVKGKLEGRVTNFFADKRLLNLENWKEDTIQHSEAWRTDSVGKPLRKLLEGNWQHAKREGIWRTWHSNGKLKDSLTYSRNELWGMQFYYDSTGHLYMSKKKQGLTGQVIVKTLDPRPEK